MHVKIRNPAVFFANSLAIPCAFSAKFPRSDLMTVLALFHDEFLMR